MRRSAGRSRAAIASEGAASSSICSGLPSAPRQLSGLEPPVAALVDQEHVALLAHLAQCGIDDDRHLAGRLAGAAGQEEHRVGWLAPLLPDSSQAMRRPIRRPSGWARFSGTCRVAHCASTLALAPSVDNVQGWKSIVPKRRLGASLALPAPAGGGWLHPASIRLASIPAQREVVSLHRARFPWRTFLSTTTGCRGRCDPTYTGSAPTAMGNDESAADGAQTWQSRARLGPCRAASAAASSTPRASVPARRAMRGLKTASTATGRMRTIRGKPKRRPCTRGTSAASTTALSCTCSR